VGDTSASPGNAQVFKKDSQKKLQMKREALEKLNCRANETPAEKAGGAFWHGHRAGNAIWARF
jgi:hypothetical protein